MGLVILKACAHGNWQVRRCDASSQRSIPALRRINGTQIDGAASLFGTGSVLLINTPYLICFVLLAVVSRQGQVTGTRRLDHGAG